MSTEVFTERYTAGSEHDIVLFRIGMRFNGLRGLREALAVFIRMPFMLYELERDPSLGLISTSLMTNLQNIELTQFWRSYEDLERYASARDHKHAPAWSWFNKLGAKSRGVGIWHETYRIAPGRYESLYMNMPIYGLAKATAHRPICKDEARAAGRMNARVCPVAHAETPAKLTIG